VNRIDRYISWLFWGYFFGALLVFVTLFTAIDAMSTMVNYKGVGLNSLLGFYSAMVPEIIYKMIPVACVLGAVLTLSNMNRANELVALFASGMSLLRIASPLLASVILISAGSYIIGDKLLPMTNRQKNYIFYHEIKKQPHMYSVIKTDRIWYRSKNTIYNLKTLNPELSTAQGLSMYFFTNEWNLLQMLTAKLVEINGKHWKLSDGAVTVFSSDSSFPMTSTFDKKTIVMDEDSQDLASTGNTSEMLSQDELARFITKNKEAGLETLRYEVDYHSKYGFAFAGFVMVLLGIPFAVGHSRSGGIMVNLGLCLGLVFAYWIMYSSALTLGGHGHLPPVAAAWLPNMIMALLGIILLRLQKR
jgi:lipopolysaccharide export system permease protein